MLDKNSVAVLKILSGTAVGKYKVYSYADLLLVTSHAKDGVSLIKQDLAELKKQGLISVVYSDEQEVCLGISSAGAGALQILTAEEEFIKKEKNRGFYAGLLGGLLGSTIIAVTEFVLRITGAM